MFLVLGSLGQISSKAPYDIVNNFRTQVDYIYKTGKMGDFRKVEDNPNQVSVRGIIKALYARGTAQQMYTMLYWMDELIGNYDHGHAYNFRMFVAQRYNPNPITNFQPDTSNISIGTKKDPLKGFSKSILDASSIYDLENGPKLSALAS